MPLRLAGARLTRDSLDDIRAVTCALLRIGGDWRFPDVERIDILPQ